MRQLLRGQLASGWARRLLDLATRLLYRDRLRPLALRLVRRYLETGLASARAGPESLHKIDIQRRLIVLAAISAVERSVSSRAVSLPVMRRVTRLWARALVGPPDQNGAVKRFREQYERDPPWFITISPGSACNLECRGCYADSDRSDAKLEWPLLSRTIAEARALWNIRVVVISGGEPLLYQSEGRTIVEIVEENPDLLFLMFTNGTLFTDDVSKRLATAGNLTPAFSVEGMRLRTDERRGTGVFDDVLKAIACARRAGLPFGISVTVTSDNVEEVVSDEFLDLFFEREKAFYAFFFQYMPIGREPNLDDMPSPAQRISFWRRVWSIIEERQLLLIDFWNHGPLVKGCISAGRGGGYLYIDWNGNVMPCVFVPYSVGNVRSLCETGRSLNQLWEAPFLETIRRWQDHYGYAQPCVSEDANWLRACPLRDHHPVFRQWIDLHRPQPVDRTARGLAPGSEYCESLRKYGEEFEALSETIWQEEFMRGGRSEAASQAGPRPEG